MPGAVKTRLRGLLDGKGAAALASAFLLDSCANLLGLGWAKVVLAAAGPLPRVSPAIETWDQGDGDLGQRLERILRRALRLSPIAIAVGADTPGLPRELLEEARSALGRADAVLGPSLDGGFYLLGLRRCPPRLLEDLVWSEPRTRRDVQRRLIEHGFSVALTGRWFDVDEPADLIRLKFLMERGCVDAPMTDRVLRSLDPFRQSRPRRQERGGHPPRGGDG